MTLESNLQASQQEAMPEFYKFSVAGQIETYTSWHKGLDFQGRRYAAAPIKRSGFSKDTDFGAVEVTISAPLIDALIAYIANQPIEPTRITLYRALSSDLTDYVTLFQGKIKSVTIKDRVASAKCEAKSDVLGRILPSVVYQSYCNHMAFDTGCGLNSLLWQVDAIISGVSGADIISTTFGSYEDGWFTGGMATVGTDMRLITLHEGNTLSLQIPFTAAVAAGTAVQVWPGCDGSPATCKAKFDNFDNFLGMPYIPDTNPVLWGLK